MKNIYYTFIMSFALYLCSVNAMATAFTIGNLRYTILSEENKTVSVRIVSETPKIQGGVTQIGMDLDDLLFNEYGVQSNNSIVSIPDVSNIEIPSEVSYKGNFYSVVEIEENGFKNVDMISITIPSSVEKIDDRAFYGCSKLTRVEIPEGVTYLAYNAFYACVGLKNVCINSSTIANPETPYTRTNNLMKVFPNVEILSIGNCVSSCSDFMFSASGVTSKLRVVNISRETSIGKNAFEFNHDLESVNGYVTNLGAYSFSFCYGLKDINLGSSVEQIYDKAFYCCSSLEKITIPENVYNIVDNAFEGCKSLKDVTINSNDLINPVTDPFTRSRNIYSYFPYVENLTLGESVTNISKFAFAKTPNSDSYPLKSVTLKAETCIVGESAFEWCINLTDFQGVLKGYVGFDAFLNCPLTKLPDFDGLESFEIGAFANTAIKEAIMPEGVTSIGAYAFQDCKDLTTIDIPSTVESISEGAFNGCCNLKSVTNRMEYVYDYNDNYDIFDEVELRNVELFVKEELISEFKKYGEWNKFCIISPFGATNLVDATPYTSGENKYPSLLRYARTFNNTNWQSLYIPFSMPYNSWCEDFEVAKINGMHQYDYDEDGVIDDIVMEVLKVKNGVLLPNHPYLIRAKEAGAHIIDIKQAEVCPAEICSIDCSSVETKFVFEGTYVEISGENLQGCYAMSGGSLSLIAKDASLMPYRWYMKVENRGSQILGMTKDIKIRVICDDATDIEEPAIASSALSRTYHSLSGVETAYPQKGINIVRFEDGSVKKVLKK